MGTPPSVALIFFGLAQLAIARWAAVPMARWWSRMSPQWQRDAGRFTRAMFTYEKRNQRVYPRTLFDEDLLREEDAALGGAVKRASGYFGGGVSLVLGALGLFGIV
ncbi:MAG: hypothetical protein ACYC6T_05900 [Thermoleophilia bacterium]